MQRRIALLSLLSVFTISAQAQLESANWYFGYNAGVSFVSGSPVVLQNGNIYNNEGCSTISDSSGTLLFYTDGRFVLNANHDTMPNGFGLLAGATGSSTQGALIMKKPGMDNQYYIFTTDESYGANGLRYSTVDMTLDAGLGDVVEKNIQLLASVDEKLTAIRNAGANGYWLLTHRHSTGIYYAYEITASGIGGPVLSNGGFINSGDSSIMCVGQLKVSPDGLHIANCQSINNKVEICDFNTSSGIVSNHFLVTLPLMVGSDFPYGTEFSPSGDVLYVCSSGAYNLIYQINMLAGTQPDIAASTQLINSGIGDVLGQMQRGLNGKIYISRHLTNYLGVIDNPESLGITCNYNDSAIALNTGVCLLGLQNEVINPHLTNVGVHEIGDNLNFQIIYSSSDGSIEINKGSDLQAQVFLRNILGQTLCGKIMRRQTKIDASALPTGVYFITIHSDKGYSTQKLFFASKE